MSYFGNPFYGVSTTAPIEALENELYGMGGQIGSAPALSLCTTHSTMLIITKTLQNKQNNTGFQESTTIEGPIISVEGPARVRTGVLNRGRWCKRSVSLSKLSNADDDFDITQHIMSTFGEYDGAIAHWMKGFDATMGIVLLSGDMQRRLDLTSVVLTGAPRINCNRHSSHIESTVRERAGHAVASWTQTCAKGNAGLLERVATLALGMPATGLLLQCSFCYKGQRGNKPLHKQHKSSGIKSATLRCASPVEPINKEVAVFDLEGVAAGRGVIINSAAELVTAVTQILSLALYSSDGARDKPLAVVSVVVRLTLLDMNTGEPGPVLCIELPDIPTYSAAFMAMFGLCATTQADTGVADWTHSSEFVSSLAPVVEVGQTPGRHTSIAAAEQIYHCIFVADTLEKVEEGLLVSASASLVKVLSDCDGANKRLCRCVNATMKRSDVVISQLAAEDALGQLAARLATQSIVSEVQAEHVEDENDIPEVSPHVKIETQLVWPKHGDLNSLELRLLPSESTFSEATHAVAHHGAAVPTAPPVRPLCSPAIVVDRQMAHDNAEKQANLLTSFQAALLKAGCGEISRSDFPTGSTELTAFQNLIDRLRQREAGPRPRQEKVVKEPKAPPPIIRSRGTPFGDVYESCQAGGSHSTLPTAPERTMPGADGVSTRLPGLAPQVRGPLGRERTVKSGPQRYLSPQNIQMRFESPATAPLNESANLEEQHVSIPSISASSTSRLIATTPDTALDSPEITQLAEDSIFMLSPDATKVNSPDTFESPGVKHSAAPAATLHFTEGCINEPAEEHIPAGAGLEFTKLRKENAFLESVVADLVHLSAQVLAEERALASPLPAQAAIRRTPPSASTSSAGSDTTDDSDAADAEHRIRRDKLDDGTLATTVAQARDFAASVRRHFDLMSDSDSSSGMSSGVTTPPQAVGAVARNETGRSDHSAAVQVGTVQHPTSVQPPAIPPSLSGYEDKDVPFRVMERGLTLLKTQLRKHQQATAATALMAEDAQRAKAVEPILRRTAERSLRQAAAMTNKVAAFAQKAAAAEKTLSLEHERAEVAEAALFAKMSEVSILKALLSRRTP